MENAGRQLVGIGARDGEADQEGRGKEPAAAHSMTSSARNRTAGLLRFTSAGAAKTANKENAQKRRDGGVILHSTPLACGKKCELPESDEFLASAPYQPPVLLGIITERALRRAGIRRLGRPQAAMVKVRYHPLLPVCARSRMDRRRPFADLRRRQRQCPPLPQSGPSRSTSGRGIIGRRAALSHRGEWAQ